MVDKPEHYPWSSYNTYFEDISNQKAVEIAKKLLELDVEIDKYLSEH